MHTLDHLLWEAWNLSEEERRFYELTGVSPVVGGQHPDSGTHNSLLSLGTGVYLELIAPDHAHPKFALAEPPDGFRPKLAAYALRTQDVNATRRSVEKAGLTPEVHAVSRVSPEGQLSWRTVLVQGHDFGNLVPFITQCDEMIHPSETSPKGCELRAFSVGHPDAESLTRLFGALQIDVPVLPADAPVIRAVLSTPAGRVVLDSVEGLVTR